MKPRTATAKGLLRIEKQRILLDCDPKENFGVGALTTANTGSNVFHSSPLLFSGLVLVVFEDAIGLDVDLSAGQLGRETRILTFLANS